MPDIPILTGPLVANRADCPVGPTVVTTDADSVLFFWTDFNNSVGGDGLPGGDADEEGNFCWRSNDGGLTWALVTRISENGFQHGSHCVWYDRWTPNYTDTDLVLVVTNRQTPDTGIHYAELDATGAVSDASINISSVAGEGDASGVAGDDIFSVTRIRNGDVFVMGYMNGDFWVYRQPSGVPFTVKQGPVVPALGSLPGSPTFIAATWIQLFPSQIDGNFLALVLSGATLRLYEWEQATTQFLSPLTIATNVSTTSGAPPSATIRHESDEIFVAYMTTSNASIQISSTGGVLSTIVLAGAGAVRSPALMCVQQSGEMYCAYLQGASASLLDVVYKRSPNGGVQWEDQVLFSEDATEAMPRLHLPMSTPSNDEGLFQPIWFSDDTGPNYRTNAVNAFPVGGYRVGTPSQQVDTGLSCSTGQQTAMGGGEESSPRFIQQRFPNTRFNRSTVARGEGVLWLNFTGNIGTLNAGDTVLGLTSGATATIFGFVANPNRVGLISILSGPGAGRGTPFLPGEQLLNTTTPKTSTINLSPNLKGTTAQSVAVIDDVEDEQA